MDVWSLSQKGSGISSIPCIFFGSGLFPSMPNLTPKEETDSLWIDILIIESYMTFHQGKQVLVKAMIILNCYVIMDSYHSI